jgi:hypothetical protein
LRFRAAVILCSAIGLGVSPVFADAGDFLPRPWENGAFFEVFGSYESDDNNRTRQPFGWDDTFLREKLTLYSHGYVYHPRFLQYQASLAGALKQEYYEASYLEPIGWTHDSGVEYDARLFFLTEHPYNLELFAVRYEPLLKEQASIQHDSVESSRGAFFQYRKTPYLVHSKYSVDTIDSGTTSTDITRLGLDGEYFKRYANGNQLSFTAAYNPSQSEATHGLTTDTTQYLLGNLIDLKSVRLNSSVTRTDFEQISPLSGRFESDQSSWYELLNVYFPYHLRSDLSYRRQDNESTFPVPGPGGERRLTDDNEDWRFDLIHRLYESLDTTYTYLDSKRSSSGGDTHLQFHSLTLNYAKRIPRGRLLAGTNLGRGETNSRGVTDIANEPHSGVSVPGPFTLNQQYVDTASIVVFLKSPLAPFNNVPLVETVHYTVATIGNSVEITVFALPPLFLVPGTYDFLVSYTLTGGVYDLDTRVTGFNTSVELFDTLLTPYYSYVAIRSDLVSGVFPGTPLDSTTNTAGLRYLRGPWRARAEYQDLEWEVSPYRAWRGEVQYIGSLSPNLNFYGTATYVNKYFPQGTSPGQPVAYTDETASVAGNIRKEVPSQGLSFSAGGAVSRSMGLVDTNAFSLNSSLTWTIGKLWITAGANAYSSDSYGAATVENDRLHQYYYVTLRRQLF